MNTTEEIITERMTTEEITAVLEKAQEGSCLEVFMI